MTRERLKLIEQLVGSPLPGLAPKERDAVERLASKMELYRAIGLLRSVDLLCESVAGGAVGEALSDQELAGFLEWDECSGLVDLLVSAGVLVRVGGQRRLVHWRQARED